MTSSMLPGERRWASARRGGMTVLGKVAAPKPLNLPSQRLENHGLDPNVEIVPKGTLSWGSRSSSSTSNVWGSSMLSPNADGTSSPSHLSDRPSSGSGTRPSTAGSDRTYEPTPCAWGQSSRPSSASGALTSNQTSLTVLRPRSAETRPGSSHLSRFAEPSSENSVSWGPTGISEKLQGMTSSKNDAFSLSSGDFPTLGLERENSGKRTDSQDHGSYDHPGSSAGGAASGKMKSLTSSVGDISVNANVKSGTAVNTCRRDDSQHVEDGVQPSVEKWQGDPPSYLNANVPPQHFDGWHGLTMNPPGVCYRGPPGGPPYGTPLAPGGFSIEPFPYYHPQIPPTALANSQPVPPPGTRPRGHHPKNGDLYRPRIHDAYIRPGMPIRPGFYPGPVAYEGYYGPPMGYCNSNEREFPFMGMAASPSVYNRYPGESARDPGNNHARATVHGSIGKMPVSEQVGSSHPDDTRGPYKVLLKQHNEWDEKLAEDKWEHSVPANAPSLEKRDQLRTSSQKSEWGLEDVKDEEFFSGRTSGGDAHSQNSDNQGTCSSDSVKVKLPESRGKVKAADDSLVNKPENAASNFPQEPQFFPATPKDPTLIQKVGDLNVKAWFSDGWSDSGSIPCREEQKRRLQVVDAMANRSANEAGTGAFCFERTQAGGNIIPSSYEMDISTPVKALQPPASSGTAISRRANHGVQGTEGRLDHHGKRFNAQDADGWRKKPLAVESIIEVAASNSEPSFNVQVQDCLASVEVAEKSRINLQGKDHGESLTPMFDASDCEAQRAKMQEIAKQRAKQLQEEEEWTREQKEKALAKLEELNRRTQTMDGSTRKLETAPPSCHIQQQQEKSCIPAAPVMVARKSETPRSALVSNPNTQIRESSTIGVEESIILFKDALLVTSDNVHPESDVSHGQPLPLPQDGHTADCKAAAQVSEGSDSRHKHMGYKQKQNIPLGKNSTEKLVPIYPTEAPKHQTDVAVNDVAYTEVVAGEVGPSCEPSLSMNSNAMAESSAHQRRKNNRSSKNKHKLDDASSFPALPSAVSKETNPSKFSTESGKPKASELELDPISVQSRTAAKHAIQPSEQNRSLTSEEADGRVNNQWKSQHSRRMPRNQQANRMTEKLHNSDAVIWAPVRSQNKSEVVDAGNRTVPDIVTETAKSDNVVQNNMKSKRAEMERYVPKPVAKELAQQGSMQQPVLSSVDQTTSEDTGGRAEPFQNIESSQPGNSAIGNIGSTAESRNGDGKPNKQSKAHESWRERGSVEYSAFVQGLQDGSSSRSHTSNNVQKSIEQYPSLKPDISSLKEQSKSSDGWDTCDGWNTPDYCETAAPVTSAVVKYQEVTVRGKRHPFKGNRSMGNSHDLDHGNANSWDTDKCSSQPPAPEICQTDKNISSTENRAVGERTSHWKPKSQVSSAHNQRGNRPSGGRNAAAEVSDAIKKDMPSQDRVHLLPQYNKESRKNMVQPPIESQFEQKNVAEASNVGHLESKRERKVASFRGLPNSANLSSVNSVELAPPANVNTQHEQHLSSGFRKNGNQNTRAGRGQESRGDWNSAEQDNRQHNTSSNWERQRHNSHYEYQPIGQHNNNKSNNFEGPTDGSHNTGSRYRERSQGHLRRGGGKFYGRQSGTVSADASYD